MHWPDLAFAVKRNIREICAALLAILVYYGFSMKLNGSLAVFIIFLGAHILPLYLAAKIAFDYIMVRRQRDL